MLNPFKKSFHKKLTIKVKGSALNSFYAFNNKKNRLMWDTLISEIENVDGSTQLDVPKIGSISWQRGKGLFKLIRTDFLMVQVDGIKIISAGKQIHPAFPFEHWAASMKNVPTSNNTSNVVYTYNFEVRSYLQFIPFAGHVVNYVFSTQTKKRFKAMSDWLQEQKGVE